ncbi:MAG: DUF45 domain-containing protein [Gammaproteobacteria bacterium]|nr:MAG: DUF45 domain-containing protein [Gammaproteobacteria bacterium]
MTPSDYKLRISKKAKYLQLRLSHQGLEVIIPAKKRLTQDAIEQFIQQKQKWIEKNRHVYDAQKEQSASRLPAAIPLHAINQTWNVSYLPTLQKKIALFTNLSQQLTIMGDIANEQQCLKKLRQWLKEIAQVHLSQHLTLLAQETQLTFKNLTIRNNSSRWGSCSSSGNISLCCKLLFLPPELMRHVLLHELCHTKAMHHGKTFWRWLEKFDENARVHAKRLKAAAAQVPLWVR